MSMVHETLEGQGFDKDLSGKAREKQIDNS
jgi:hypothetical protein